ncbi:receptor activity-modifying protein 2 isoform X2 [Microcaecilia unicolor]|uniref:Receptor activity-modifying protein 2 isoform X2 n=1 Tax=Microcaecilia unicolor TaxID=1415580 RepID=A0A6P7ZB68_9AMPH|nr:receptor activity-modifying protein 2 isoform X2 [Microcaecilia unicolor]
MALCRLRRALQLAGLLLWWVFLKEDPYCVNAELANPVNDSGEEWQPHAVTDQATPLLNLTIEEIDWYRSQVENCWKGFIHLMSHVASRDWCNWEMISSPYSIFQQCLEGLAEKGGYYYPNMCAESYIIKGHKTYFSNCTSQYLFDPPEDILLPIIIAPICIIPFLVMLVVWKSKNGKPQI